MSTAFKGKGPLPRLQTSWDLRAACNFIGGGTGTGLLICTAVLALFGYPYSGTIALGLVCVAFGLLMVWLEIGRPWRSMNLFFNPQTSWMTREGILAIPLFALAALALFYHPKSGGTVITGALGIIAAGYLYCQARMLNGAKGIPSWAHPAIVPYLMVTGLTEGMGLAVCFPALGGRSVLTAFVLLLLLRMAAWLRYTHGLQRDRAPQDSLRVINGFKTIYLLAGHLLPIILLTATGLEPGWHAVLVPAAGLLAAMAGWLSKAVIITRAAHTHGFVIPRMPGRGQVAGNGPALQGRLAQSGTGPHA